MRLLKNKKGAEETSSFMIWLIVGVLLLILIIGYTTGFFGKLGTLMGLTSGLDMEAMAQSCAKFAALSGTQNFAFCTFKEVTLADGRTANVNCLYTPIFEKLDQGITCPSSYNALEFCKGKNASLSASKFKNILVSNDKSADIVKCSDLLAKTILPVSKSCNDPIINGAWVPDCQGAVEYTEFAADKAQHLNEKCCIAGTIAA